MIEYVCECPYPCPMHPDDEPPGNEMVAVCVSFDGVKLAARMECLAPPLPRWRLRLIRLLDRDEKYASLHYIEGWNDARE